MPSDTSALCWPHSWGPDVQVTQLFTAYVEVLLQEAATNREANWRSKDAAMYLVTALAVTGKTAAKGATSTNQAFDITNFFQTQVAPSGNGVGQYKSRSFSASEPHDDIIYV